MKDKTNEINPLHHNVQREKKYGVDQLILLLTVLDTIKLLLKMSGFYTGLTAEPLNNIIAEQIITF